jgi:hypothetical protein
MNDVGTIGVIDRAVAGNFSHRCGVHQNPKKKRKRANEGSHDRDRKKPL